MKKTFLLFYLLFSVLSTKAESPINQIISFALNELEGKQSNTFLCIDVKKIVNENVSIQPNKYYYESGNNIPMDFEQFALWRTSIEQTLVNFNQNQTDSLRIYVIAIKNLELVLPIKIDSSLNDSNSNFIESIEKIKKSKRELATLHKIFGSIIRGISERSRWHAVVLGVGHFYSKTGANSLEHFFSKYLELKKRGVLSDINKRNELRTIIQQTLKDAPNENPIGSVENDVLSLIENIRCSLYGNCEQLSFPIEIEGPGIFSSTENASSSQSPEITIGQSAIEFIDLCNLFSASEIQSKLSEWSSVCEQQQLKLKVCISTFENHPNALRQLNYFRNNLPENSIFIWYHKRSDGRMLCDIRFAENINDKIFQKIDAERRKKIIKEYIKQNGEIQSFIEFIPASFAKVIADLLEQKITIPEKYYLKTVPSYSYLYKAILLGNLPENTQFLFAELAGISPLSGVNPVLHPDLGFAFICGIYNGILENTGGVFRALEIFNSTEKIKLLGESLKAFFSNGTDSLYQIISSEFKASYLSDNIYKRAYFSGKLTINVLSCFVGVGEINALLATGKLSVEFTNAAKIIQLLKASTSKLTQTGLKLGGSLLSFCSVSGKWIVRYIKNPLGEIIVNPKIYVSKAFNFSANEINSLFSTGKNNRLEKYDELFNSSNEKIGSLYKDVNNGEIVFAGKEVWKATCAIGSRIDAYVRILEKDLNLAQWIKTSFKDELYYTVETTQRIKLFRDFGDQAFLDGSFCTTINNGTREGLAIHPSFHNSMRFKAEIEIPVGEKINIGKAGPYPPGDVNALPGGEDQVLLKTNYDHAWIKSIKDTQTGELMTLTEFREKYPQLIRFK